MKNQFEKMSAGKTSFRTMAFFAILIIGLSTGCSKTDLVSPTDSTSFDPKLMNSNYAQVNLVGDNDEYAPMFIDAGLVNAWGLSINDEGEIWVNAADGGFSATYGADGETLAPHVLIPGAAGEAAGAPTGVIYNSSETFTIPGGDKSEFIFCTEDGTVAAWASGGSATTVADRSASGSNYKGLAMARKDGNMMLFVTDFHNGKIDAFDGNFQYIDGFSFTDPDMPAGYAPFNIRYIDGLLYVTYAKQLAPDNDDDQAGPGNGFIDLYQTDGKFIKRFASGGSLNSPWGIEKTSGRMNAILVGNFGDGKISVFTKNGQFMSYLQSGGTDIEIEGLWALVMPHDDITGDAHDRIYFTSGPDEESHGLFGYLDPQE